MTKGSSLIMNNKIDILGVQFDNVSKKDLCRIYADMLNGKSSGYVVTPNPEIIEYSLQDKEYRGVLNRASLSLADGIGVIYASRYLGTPICERIPGIEAGEKMLCLLNKRKKESIFFLGAEKGVAEKAAKKLSEKYKNLIVSGVRDGFFKYEENDDVIGDINKSGAEVLFVCMGYPRQEKWISENLGRLHNIKVAFALGGSLDVYSGNVKRAPCPIRAAGFEWLWRICTIPGHLKRMSILPLFVRHTIMGKMHKK